jgi:predicted transcriptional regulator
MEESENRLGVDNMAGAVKTDEATTDSSNILDDMEKFQREIDALRTRYQ